MRLYLRAHELSSGLLATSGLALGASLSSGRVLPLPQLVDRITRGTPLQLVFAAGAGAVVLRSFPVPSLRLELGQHRTLLRWDLLAVGILFLPVLAVSALVQLTGAAGAGSAILVGFAVMAGLAVAVALVTSPQVAATSPVVYLILMGTLGTRPDGRPRLWAFPLTRAPSGWWAVAALLALGCVAPAIGLVRRRADRLTRLD